MKSTSLFLSTLIISSSLISPSFSQTVEEAANMQRMDRMEHDLMLLQKQISRGDAGVNAAPSRPISEDEIAANGGTAQLDVRLAKMDEDLRKLRGKVEELEFQNRKLGENFEKFQRDTEFRFNEMYAGGAAPAATDTASDTAVKSERKPIAGNETASSPAAKTEKPSDKPAEKPDQTTAGDGKLKAPEDGADNENFATPRDHYNYAFRLLNQTKYEDAAKAFDAFTKKYPKDPLVGNAYYWQGETYYIRRDYVAAADNFRQGFEVLPNGPKAADNLLKLAMSLNALQRDKEACVVLGQVVTKFKKSSVSITEKAMQEQKRIGCK